MYLEIPVKVIGLQRWYPYYTDDLDTEREYYLFANKKMQHLEFRWSDMPSATEYEGTVEYAGQIHYWYMHIARFIKDIEDHVVNGHMESQIFYEVYYDVLCMLGNIEDELKRKEVEHNISIVLDEMHPVKNRIDKLRDSK